ncbi:DUF1330 domain-containing protein [uncultured Croceitalea sp.]|uniref:DUF1330 domain-containing protein n=1 Tax=uncultured Croceitalea sp. TaxID=1798908 RepID=UPI00330675CC
MKLTNHINANQKQGQFFFKALQNSGEFILLNLLKFKSLAEYDAQITMKLKSNISGKEAYERYFNAVQPELEKIGSTILFRGDCLPFLVGPENEHWDTVILVKHKSVRKFIEFSQSKAYLENKFHRNVALDDSRLLPIIP